MSVLPDDFDDEELEAAALRVMMVVNARYNKWLRKRRILYVELFLLGEMGGSVKLEAFYIHHR